MLSWVADAAAPPVALQKGLVEDDVGALVGLLAVVPCSKCLLPDDDERRWGSSRELEGARFRKGHAMTVVTTNRSTNNLLLNIADITY
jgi:hypothetical protein